MKRIVAVFLLTFAFISLTGTANAVEKLVESVAKGCVKELESYCSKVKPGDGRVLACLYAHGDKLSGSCEYALYDAAAQLERFIAALTYVANECDNDLEKHCTKVEAGEGRLAQCLLDNKAKLTERCVAAIDNTGLKAH